MAVSGVAATSGAGVLGLAAAGAAAAALWPSVLEDAAGAEAAWEPACEAGAAAPAVLAAPPPAAFA